MATLTPFNIAYNSAPFAAWNDASATRRGRDLGSANTAEDISVPSTATIVRITAEEDIWINYDKDAASPSGDIALEAPYPVAKGSDYWFSFAAGSITNISVVSAIAGAGVVAFFWDE